MNVARILYPVETLGPGKRIGIWFAGCPRRCKGCSNPELWEKRKDYEIDINHVIKLILKIYNERPVDGFTITGGDPFYQKESLRKLIARLSEINSDILVYTGYYKNQINPAYLQNIAVLVDGPYEEEKNDGTFLRGSSNQNIYILKKEYEEKYSQYLIHGKNAIQNFVAGGEIISVGIHAAGFNEEFPVILQERGLTNV